MKSQKLLVIAAIVCLLVGVSGGAAMAGSCGDGLLQNETFDGNLVIRDEPCSIIGSTINGNLRVINSDHVLLMNNKIGGSVRVRDGGVATVIANTVFGGNLVVKDNDSAHVIENETLAGNIRVNFNTSALVQKNISVHDLICRENTSLDSFINFAGNKLDCD
jgi:DUF4097 and DUF4098 domain-containing protein YvlB